MEKNKNLLNKIKFSTKFNNSSDIALFGLKIKKINFMFKFLYKFMSTIKVLIL